MGLKKINSYYISKLNKNGTDIKQIYQFVTELTKGKNQKQGDKLRLNDNNKIPIIDDQSIENYANEYSIYIYASIGAAMAEKINYNTNYIKLNVLHANSLFLTPVTTSEIIKHINSLKNKCSAGVDTINTYTIKIINKHVLKPLKHIINLM